MTFYALLIISVHKILNFMHFSQKRDIHTDGRTNGRTEGPLDTPSYYLGQNYKDPFVPP